MKKITNFLIMFLVIALFGLFVASVVVTFRNTLTHYEAVAATCTEDGNVEYWYDKSSGKYYADEEGTQELESVVVEATGHNYDRSGACADCGAKIEGLNDWYSDTVFSFTYNGLALDDHTVYYLTDDDSCYYIEYGVIYYVYTAEDIENGLEPIAICTSLEIPGKWVCMSGHFGIGICWSDNGDVYSLYNIRAPHIVGDDGVCTRCGETVE